MLRGLMRAMRYARSWENGTAAVLHEATIERDGKRLPATFAVPASHRGDLPGWIVLGGVTSMGRFHPQLTRFSQALAASGAGVIVPEVPEWSDLRLTPGLTVPTVQAALCALDQRPEVRRGKVGLIGVSFGAPQAAIASSHEDLAERIAAVVAFGGYCDLERTLRCQLTGLHEWEGVTRRIDPDPYGRWVLASNYLTEVPGCEEAADVAASLRRLALSASQQRVPAWDSRHDVLKGELRSCLDARWHALFDMFAPAADSLLVRGEECEAMAVDLAGACRSSMPLLDPKPALGHIRVPIHIFHGRSDRLVPYTESLRFKEALPDDTAAAVTVTRLFAHSADQQPSSVAARIRERLILFRALQGMINAVG